MGRQYDQNGGLRDWWTAASSKAFQTRAECLVSQFGNYSSADGSTKVNGKLTLGENIGDQGGVKLAYRAWKSASPSKQAFAGYSTDQQFFIAGAQAWCSKNSTSFELMVLSSDPHAPDRYRVNGTFANSPDFAQAFQCKTGQVMAPKERCEVW